VCLSGGCNTATFRFSFLFRALPLLQRPFFLFIFAFDWVLGLESIAFCSADADFFAFLFLGKTSKALFGLVGYLPVDWFRKGFHALYLI
jgi:hypothetical protein